nr:hypothetical protein [Tanacetum cinerariifolium]
RPTLYDEKVIGLGYTTMFLIHSNEALEIKKFKRSKENKIEFAYDYGNLNASYVNEMINFEDDYFQEIINPDFDKIDSLFQQSSSLKPYVLNMSLEKIITDLEDGVVSLLKKEKANLKTIESLKSKGFESSETVISESENPNENDCQVVEKECHKVENLKVIAPGMFKLNVSLCVSLISMSKSSCDSNNVEIKLKRKRRKRKSSKQNVKQVDNDVSHANSDFVYFSDLDTFSSVRRPKHSSVVWKKKGSSNTSNVALSVISASKLNKYVKRYSRKDLLACNNSHLGETSSAYVCNDAMNISCNPRMCDLLDDNNFFIFDDESIKISPVSKMPFRKKPCDSINARSKSNMIKSSPRTMRKWFSKLQPLAEPICLWIIDSGCSKHMTGNRALLTNFVEKFLGTICFGNNDFAVIAGYGYVVIGSMTIKKVYYVEGLGHNLFSVGQFCEKGLEDVGKLKAKGDIGVFVGYSKESAAFRIYNKQTRKIHESVNVNFDEILKMASKQFSLEPGLSNLNESGKSLNPLVSKIIKSSTTNVETPINEEVFHEEEVYVGQPPGFISEQYPDHVYALDKALYGLKQAPQAWIFRYLKGTINLGLWYLKDSGFDLTAYSDTDHAGCHLDRKSTSGSVQFLGDKLVCWSSKKQNYVSISSTESEYVAVSSCCA